MLFTLPHYSLSKHQTVLCPQIMSSSSGSVAASTSAPLSAQTSESSANTAQSSVRKSNSLWNQYMTSTGQSIVPSRLRLCADEVCRLVCSAHTARESKRACRKTTAARRKDCAREATKCAYMETIVPRRCHRCAAQKTDVPTENVECCRAQMVANKQCETHRGGCGRDGGGFATSDIPQ